MTPPSSIRIVLFEPQHPGNIGAVARAMKTMALRRLVLVRPAEFPAREADRRALGATDLLQRARVVDELERAIGDCSLVIGSSARSRTHALPVVDPRECAGRLVEEATRGAEVALLLGPERCGLPNEALSRCNYQVRIPTDADFSSLNLGAAAQLLCYEILIASLAARPDDAPPPDPTCHPTTRELDYFFARLEDVLEAHRRITPQNREATMAKIRALFGRARPELGELKLLHTLVGLMEREPE